MLNESETRTSTDSEDDNWISDAAQEMNIVFWEAANERSLSINEVFQVLAMLTSSFLLNLGKDAEEDVAAYFTHQQMLVTHLNDTARESFIAAKALMEAQTNERVH